MCQCHAEQKIFSLVIHSHVHCSLGDSDVSEGDCRAISPHTIAAISPHTIAFNRNENKDTDSELDDNTELNNCKHACTTLLMSVVVRHH